MRVRLSENPMRRSFHRSAQESAAGPPLREANHPSQRRTALCRAAPRKVPINPFTYLVHLAIY